MQTAPHSQLMAQAHCAPDDVCPLCLGALVTKKLKRFCTRCGQLCETCCDGGQAG